MFRSMKTQDRKRGPYAKSAQRRRQIIEAAFDVFAARGYQGGSLQEVADRVGLGHTSILHYFPSKRALLIAVLLFQNSPPSSAEPPVPTEQSASGGGSGTPESPESGSPQSPESSGSDGGGSPSKDPSMGTAGSGSATATEPPPPNTKL